MAQRLVKCPGCCQMIDRDFEFDWTKHGNRYWHDNCWDNKNNQETTAKSERDNIITLAAQCLGAYADYKKIGINISQLIKHGLTYQQIERSLNYWYNIKHNDPSKSNGGIWIVDSIYSDADNYFQRLEKIKSDQEKSKNIDIGIDDKPRVYVRPRPVNILRPKQRFNLDQEGGYLISKYYDSEAAIQVIGCCMHKPDYLASDGRFFFSEEDFCNDLHKVIFGALYNLYNSGVTNHLGREIEPYLKDKPKSLAIYKANNGRKWMMQTFEDTHVDAFDYYYNRLKKMSLLRAYDSIGVDVSDIYDPDNILDLSKKQSQDEYFDRTSLEQLADDIESKFYFIRDFYVNNNDSDSVLVGDGINELIDDLRHTPARGWAMYDAYEDAIAMGARRGKFYLRSGSSGSGKSRSDVADACFFSCSEYYNDRGEWEKLYNRIPTLYISVELDIEELQTMALSFIGNIPEDHILDPELLTFEEEERLRKSMEILSNAPLRMQYLPNYGLKDVDNCIKRNIRKYKYPRVNEQGGTDYLSFQCVVFDYLTSSIKMIEEISQGTGMRVREDQILFLMSSKLKDIAVENNIFMLSNTQINGKPL